MSYTVLNSNNTIFGHAVRFEWHGGEYVDLYFDGASYPYDVINVWDHASSDNDGPRYPFTRAGLTDIVSEWRAETSREEIAAYIENNRF